MNERSYTKGSSRRQAFRAIPFDGERPFPDVVMAIDFMIAEGDMVAARWTITATHKGDLPMAKATGKAVKFSGINSYRFAGGKVVELWNHRDDLSMLMQLGVIPSPKQALPATSAKPPTTTTR